MRLWWRASGRRDGLFGSEYERIYHSLGLDLVNFTRLLVDLLDLRRNVVQDFGSLEEVFPTGS